MLQRFVRRDREMVRFSATTYSTHYQRRDVVEREFVNCKTGKPQVLEIWSRQRGGWLRVSDFL